VSIHRSSNLGRYSSQVISRKSRQNDTSTCVVLSLILHLIIAGLLLIKIDHHQQLATPSPVSIVQAFSINQNEVEQMLSAKAATTTHSTQELNTATITTTTTPHATNTNIPEHKKLNLDETLKKRVFEAQVKEAQILKKKLLTVEHQAQQELIKNKKKLEQQKKQLLQNMLQKELTAESKQLKKSAKQLHEIDQEKSKTNTTETTNNATTKNNGESSAAKSTITSPKTAGNLQLQGEVDKYKNMVVQAISQEWIVPDGTDKSDWCKLLIEVRPGGAVVSVTVIQASKNPLLDRSAQNAILKASPLPVPQDHDTFDHFRTITLTVRPQEIVSN